MVWRQISVCMKSYIAITNRARITTATSYLIAYCALGVPIIVPVIHPSIPYRVSAKRVDGIESGIAYTDT